MAGIKYPTVNPADVKGFAQAWDCSGIKMVLDNVSMRFAVDFANVVLKSYVDDLVVSASKVRAAKIAAQQTQPTATPTDAVAQTVAPQSAPQKSMITLTDM
jgi:hypothetical protein